MKTHKNKLIEQVSKNRTALIEILTAAFIVGVCASIFGAYIFDVFKQNKSYLFGITALLLIVSFVFLSKKLGSTRKNSIDIEGFLVYNPKDNTLHDVPEYHYGEKIRGFINSAFSENKALKKQWDKEPISSLYNSNFGSVHKSNSASLKLIREATEYYVLDKLSMHLTDYFNEEKYNASELKEYSRSDVPDILLKNRFMELFTSSMENRASFHDQASEKDNIVMSMGANGEIYHRFDLTLPKNSVVTRENNQAIKIETKYFTLVIAVDFEGFGYVLPRDFEKHYLGITDHESCSEYMINVKIDVEFKLLSLVSPGKWNYHSWLDGFIATIESDMNGEMFFEKINWNNAYTLIRCGQVSSKNT